MKTATKTALVQIRSLGLVPTLIVMQTKSGLATDVVTYPMADWGTQCQDFGARKVTCTPPFAHRAHPPLGQCDAEVK